MKSLSVRINRILDSWFGAALLVVSLFFLQTPYFFAVIPAVYTLIPILRWGLIFVLGFTLLFLHGSVPAMLKKELLLWGVLLWCVMLCISQHLNGKGIREVAVDLIPSVLLAVLVIAVFFRVNVKKFLFVLFFYFLVINTLNNVSAGFFINGGIWIGPFGASDPEYIFFGHINEGITCGLNSLLFGILYSHIYDRKWEVVNWVNLVFSLFSAWAIDCKVQLLLYAAGAAALLCCYVYRRFPEFGKVLRFISLKTVMVLNLLILDAVVLLGESGWIQKLGIDPSLHSRRPLWNTVLLAVKDHLPAGLGYTSWINVMMDYGLVKTFWHQHSIYLQILYETGLIGVAIMAVVFGLAIWKTGKLESVEIRFLLGVLVGGFFLVMVVEVCQRSEIFLLLAVCFCLPGALENRYSSARRIA